MSTTGSTWTAFPQVSTHLDCSASDRQYPCPIDALATPTPRRTCCSVITRVTWRSIIAMRHGYASATGSVDAGHPDRRRGCAAGIVHNRTSDPSLVMRLMQAGHTAWAAGLAGR